MNYSQISTLTKEYGNIFQAELGETIMTLIEDGCTNEEVRDFLEKAPNVHGDLIVTELADGSVITATGKMFIYLDESYANDSTGYNTVSEGRWQTA